MTIHKKPVEEREHEVEKYRFIKEQVRPQQKKNVAKFIGKVFSVMFLAVIFGSVAGAVFHFVNNRFKDDSDISDYLAETLRPEVSSSADDFRDKSVLENNISQSDISTIDQYDYVSKKIASIGNGYRYALVKVKGVMSDSKWYDNSGDDSGVTYGAIFKATKNEYFIMTDSSAVNGIEEVTIEFYNGDVTKAGVLGVDTNINLAVLRVAKSTVVAGTRRKLAVASIGSVSGIKNGSNIIAVGAPNGIMYSVMTGKVIKSDIGVSVIDNRISLYATDIVSSSLGNGIILNTDGEMIGFINNRYQNISGDGNMGFISINSVHDIMELLVHGKSIAYLGIEGTDVDADTAVKHNLVKGIYVTSVFSSSPAYIGGMRVADVIEKIDGESIKTIYALHNILLNHKSGDEIKVEVSRKLKNKRKNITLSIVLN